MSSITAPLSICSNKTERFVPFLKERDEMGRLFMDTKARLLNMGQNSNNKRNNRYKPHRIFVDRTSGQAKYDYDVFNFPIVRSLEVDTMHPGGIPLGQLFRKEDIVGNKTFLDMQKQ